MLKKKQNEWNIINMNNIIKVRQVHPYHQVDNSPWPILISIAIFNFAIAIVNKQVNKVNSNLIYFQIVIIVVMIVWWRDVVREAIGGYHTSIVQQGIYIGFLIFLISEIMQFGSQFWSFFHSSLAPAVDLGSTWPPIGIKPVNTWAIPLQGSCILQASGFILTEAHHATIAGDKNRTLLQIFNTIILGFLFLFFQGTEYYWGEFTLADSVFGTVFYSTTSQHGLHVLIGVIFIIISFIRIFFDNLTTSHNLNYEFSIYYWHLVDIIWIIVFIQYYYY